MVDNDVTALLGKALPDCNKGIMPGRRTILQDFQGMLLEISPTLHVIRAGEFERNLCKKHLTALTKPATTLKSCEPMHEYTAAAGGEEEQQRQWR